MHENADSFPDDVPIADAVEQQRTASESAPNDDNAASWPEESEVPLEATDSDWREQQEALIVEPEFEEPE
ncbi:hypothetical protein [Mycobacterium stomatepiae]|uniref:Uncharacterized protein n=1 Tax=Mycobacterium stomatepiae TaxID=470076 RepID=A0A7I7Q3Q0_9MYCO|nr:hypothetical protein [Mycobacterium stomatepiae]MCV7165832.1 hypothetical protein [Mycobacterium stomatepiae]BBY20702.1 hypothetical protein MSTO_09070 [Mycobacterium stomatepiae]